MRPNSVTLGIHAPTTILAVSIAALLGGNAARADTGSGDADVTLAEIVVSAGKVGDQALQDTAMAITAFSASDLDGSALRNVNDIAAFSANLTSSSFASRQVTSIRGIGTNWSFLTGDPSVTVQIDGVYISRPYSHQSDFLDVERIEVIRGPQGTLYGRNSTGGVINIVTRRPGDTWSGTGRVSLGNYDLRRFEGSVSGPLGDRAGVSLAVQYSKRDGYVENRYPDRKDLLDEDRISARGKLVFDVTDRIKATLAADFSNIDDMPSVGPTSVIPFGEERFDDIWTVSHDELEAQETRDKGASLTVDAMLSDQVRLTNIVGWRDSSTWYAVDYDASEFPIVYQNPLTEDSRVWTEELQLSGKSDRLTWVTGLFLFRERGYIGTDVLIRPAGVAFVQESRDFESKAWALFGQMTYSFSPRWAATIGLRYSEDRKEDVLSTEGFKAIDPEQPPSRTLSNNLFLVPFAIVQPEKRSWNAVTPKFGLDFKPNDDLLLYASATRGYKPGGFNANPAPGENFTRPVDEETVWSYELGFKSTWLGGAATVNVAAFYSDFKDLQVLGSPRIGSGNTLTNLNINAEGAEIKGLELEIRGRPMERFDVLATLALLKAKYKGDVQVVDAVTNLVVDADGNYLSNAPKVSGSLVMQYRLPLGAAGDLTLRGEFSYKDDVFYSPANNAVERQGSYSLFNAHATWAAPGGHWTFGVHAKNLSNKEYFERVAFGSPATTGVPGAPRTVLVSASYAF